ncbi:hypothetical protein [Gymnodinialimonas sp. 57CJ19]|uniref:hypothetical protein n=1 Tax=Gymnodinialimonas sp. 57CJ19 TaxID=3138498 RepID=UPI0031342D8E
MIRWFRKRPVIHHGPPVGRDRASRVCDHLDQEFAGSDRSDTAFAGLINYHRDYCGHGVFRDHRGYFVALSTDGYPTTALHLCEDREAFVAWLSERTDEEMSGEAGGLFGSRAAGPIGNQRLSRGRIDHLLAVAKS